MTEGGGGDFIKTFIFSPLPPCREILLYAMSLFHFIWSGFASLSLSENTDFIFMS